MTATNGAAPVIALTENQVATADHAVGSDLVVRWDSAQNGNFRPGIQHPQHWSAAHRGVPNGNGFAHGGLVRILERSTNELLAIVVVDGQAGSPRQGLTYLSFSPIWQRTAPALRAPD